MIVGQGDTSLHILISTQEYGEQTARAFVNFLQQVHGFRLASITNGEKSVCREVSLNNVGIPEKGDGKLMLAYFFTRFKKLYNMADFE